MNSNLTTTLAVSEDTLVHVAAELAANLRPAADVIKDAGLTTEHFKLLARTAQFKTVFGEAKRLWHADTNTTERIRAKALMALESMLIQVVRMVNDPETSAAAKLEGVKITTKLAGMEKQDTSPESGARFSVTINLPGKGSTTIEAERVIETVAEDD